MDSFGNGEMVISSTFSGIDTGAGAGACTGTDAGAGTAALVCRFGRTK